MTKHGPLRLSVIDLQWPGNLEILLPALERLGYYRFWASEHHAAGQSASPTVIAAIAASQTSRIRVGTAGILLNYASPLRIAEDFALLELFFSGRIDLGIARGAVSA